MGADKDMTIRRRLLRAYALSADERNDQPRRKWKQQLRGEFLALLQAEGRSRLLEIGAGPGHDGQFYQEHGLQVICTDFSPDMVRHCLTKGLLALIMDAADPAFGNGAFDAIYSLNCLLHIPKAELPDVLKSIRRLLKPSGLFFLGLYGGYDFEGIWDDDHHEPKRFFSLYSDEHITDLVGRYFRIHSIRHVEAVEGSQDLHHQSFILRKPISP